MLPILLLLLLAGAGIGAATAKPTAYEALAAFDFPPGIIPKGVVDYTLDNSTGDFAAYLNSSSTCEFSIQGSYSLRYQPTIKGRISVDRLTNLQGVSVKVLFFWLNIIEVTRNGDDLGFSVGIASADFGLDNFLESPTCGCGFDCNNLSLQQPAESSLRLRDICWDLQQNCKVGLRMRLTAIVIGWKPPLPFELVSCAASMKISLTIRVHRSESDVCNYFPETGSEARLGYNLDR